MKHIQQKHDTGCGVACVAMVARVTYDEAKDAVFPGWTEKKTVFKTRWGQLRDAMVELYRVDYVNAEFVKTGVWMDIPKGAIVRLVNRKKNLDHWVVKDNRGDAFLDPSLASRQIGSPPHIHGYIKID